MPILRFDRLEFLIDSRLDLGGFAVQSSESAKSPHPSGLAGIDSSQADTQLVAQRFRNQFFQGLTALRRSGLGLAKERIREFKSGFHVTIFPYLWAPRQESPLTDENRATDLGAAFLCAELSIKRELKHNASYLQNWLGVLKQDKTALFRAAADASRAAEYLHSLQPAANADRAV
jgi:hypothetical protein